MFQCGIRLLSPFVIVGFSLESGASAEDGNLRRPGPLTWERAFGGAKDDFFTAAVAAPDGGWLLAGGTESQGSGEADGWVIKVDDEGRLN